MMSRKELLHYIGTLIGFIYKINNCYFRWCKKTDRWTPCTRPSTYIHISSVLKVEETMIRFKK